MTKPSKIGTVESPRNNQTKAVENELDVLQKGDAAQDFGVLEYPLNILERSGHFIMFHIVETTPGSGVIEGTDKQQALKVANQGLDLENSEHALSVKRTLGRAPRSLANAPQTTEAKKRARDIKDIKAGGIKRAERTRLALVNNAASSTDMTTLSQVAMNQQTKQTIVMYMPEKITTAYGLDYQGESLQIAAAGKGLIELTGQVLSGAVSISEAAKSELIAELGEQYGLTLGANFIDQLGSLVGAQVGAKAFLEKNRRRVVNPHMQFMFRAVNQRSFEYSFSLVANSEDESKAIDNIIRTFKFFAHPTVSDAGRYHGYPAEFDIQYYSRELDSSGQDYLQENDWINRIGRCYLSSISVDYSGAGIFSTHKHQESAIPNTLQGETAKIRSGNPPTHISISLTFSELETLNRQHIKEGF